MSYSHFMCPVFLSSARIKPLQEPATRRSPATVGVENTQPPVLNSQRNGVLVVVTDASRVWDPSSPGKSRRTANRKFPNVTLTSRLERHSILFVVSADDALQIKRGSSARFRS